MSSRFFWVLSGEPSRGPDSYNLRQKVDGTVVRSLDWDRPVPAEVMEALCHLVADANVEAMLRHQLETVAAEAYQAVASMAVDLGVMGDEHVQRLLENLQRARHLHQDVLPWPSFEKARPAEKEPHIVKLQAWGGQSRHHDYLMSDGTVRTLKDTEAQALWRQHSDESVVDRFAEAMKEKLAAARRKGRHGWELATGATLSTMLRDHVEKGDPLDVANFCMFLWSLELPIESAVHTDEEGTTWTVPTAEAYAKVCRASQRQREALRKIKELVEAGQGRRWDFSATNKSRCDIFELCMGALEPSKGEKR